MRLPSSAALGLALAIGVLPACGNDAEPSPAATTTSSVAAGGTVDVTLKEFAIGTSVSSAPAGSVTFEATNEGPNDDHEFLVIQTDLGITDLPTNADGAVDEEGEGINVIDEIPEFPPGETQSLTVGLDAGNYVFICNVFDKKEHESHYQEGMRTSFTVS
jgi:uncharacterized cupredoxin-like copper-binding protein